MASSEKKKIEKSKPSLMVPLCTDTCGPCVLGKLLACNTWIMSDQATLARPKLI